ncbi:hypothetical protein PoB_004695100 [Plakobranchus ocellatus]|uniref:Uncharacterized protein n=1 Tax=Plakobranchus ocellatus TaxID=259542 RepID=A0AAV4BN61_9GAST|nr:hypothetical protein PoB_004695100 [Plakobranchus ocellatus]
MTSTAPIAHHQRVSDVSEYKLSRVPIWPNLESNLAPFNCVWPMTPNLAPPVFKQVTSGFQAVTSEVKNNRGLSITTAAKTAVTASEVNHNRGFSIQQPQKQQ